MRQIIRKHAFIGLYICSIFKFDPAAFRWLSVCDSVVSASDNVGGIGVTEDEQYE